MAIGALGQGVINVWQGSKYAFVNIYMFLLGSNFHFRGKSYMFSLSQ